MRKIKDAIIKFFYGRNGVDSLNKFIFILYLASTLAYIITNHISALINLINLERVNAVEH